MSNARSTETTRPAATLSDAEVESRDERLIAACMKVRFFPLVIRCFENGLLLFYGGLYSNVIEFTPALTLSRAEVDQGVEVIDRSLSDVEAGRVPDKRLGKFLGW